MQAATVPESLESCVRPIYQATCAPHLLQMCGDVLVDQSQLEHRQSALP